MMNQVILHTDGSIHTDDHRCCEVKSVTGHLGDRVLLTDGYCLRSFFRMLAHYPVLQELNAFLPDLMDRYFKIGEAASACTHEAIFEFGKTIEMIGSPGKPRLEIYTSLRAASKPHPLEIRSVDLPGLLDIPVRLGKLRHIIFGDRVDVFEFDTAYTLFEFIDGIAWELGFHNAPGECSIRR